jgi:AbrB family looped-hinge helix DNA binding protein
LKETSLHNNPNSDILKSDYKRRCVVDTANVAIAEIKARGQITIPKKIREISHLEEGQAVSIIPLGDSLIITPKRLELDEARREIRKVLKSSNMTIEELMDGLREERDGLYQETYGKNG